MKTGAAIFGFVVTGAIGVLVGLALKDSGGGKQVTVSKQAQVADDGKKPDGAPPAEAIVKVPTGGSPQKGPDDALVTIVEFSDFECPFCGKVLPTLKQIQDTYGDKVRIVFKHNPLPFHKNAPLASEYAIAAAKQGKFWEMHDVLFQNNRELGADKLDGYAQSVGVDVAKLKADLQSGEAKRVIQADQALAAKIGARGTPGFYINGVKVSGAQPFANFKKVIDEELAKAEKLVASGTAKGQVYDKIMATARETAPAPEPKKPEPEATTRQKVELVDGTPTKGGQQPLVTIVEWSDFQCPFCSRAVPSIKQILETYGDKVQIRFRHQPLSFHQRALPAAKASMAAAKQGKFWEMHDKMFENAKALEDADLERYAKEIGLDMGKFKADMADSQIAAKIQQDSADGNKYGARGTPSFFVNGIPVRGAQPFPAFKVVIDKELELAEKLMKEGVARKDVYNEIMKREAGKAAPGAQAQAAPPPAPTGPVDIALGRAPVTGPSSAPIEVVVFSDFECPFCGRVNPSIDQLKKDYKGKIKVAFKHYPLPFHRNAELAAVASLAAHKQGKFWEMHDKLFENQRALQRDSLIGYAKELGLDTAKFEKDLDDSSLKDWVKQDMAEGSKVGVRGTPATFINGRLVSGAQPYDNFKNIVEDELKKKS